MLSKSNNSSFFFCNFVIGIHFPPYRYGKYTVLTILAKIILPRYCVNKEGPNRVKKILFSNLEKDLVGSVFALAFTRIFN